MSRATIENLAYAIQQRVLETTTHKPPPSVEGSALARRALVPLKPQGTRPPFFCVHPAGGNVLCYRNLAARLDPDQPFYALQPPNLEGQGAPYPAVEVMAADYLAAVRTVQPYGPYYLGGWSFGGVVAFAMAQQLLAEGERVGLLALMDTVAPMPFQYFDEAVMIANVIRELGFPRGQEIEISIRDLRQRTPEEQLAAGLEVMRQAGLVTEDMGSAWLRRLAEAYRCSIDVTQAYHPAPYPGEVTLFRAMHITNADIRYLQQVFNMPPIPPLIMKGMMAAMKPIAKWLTARGKGSDNLNWLADDTLGWRKFSTRPIHLHRVSGDHLTFVAEPHVQVLAEALDTELRRAKT